MLSIFFIGLALSMDALSLAVGIGSIKLTQNQKIRLSVLVGSMHFIMPIMGLVIGEWFISPFGINLDILEVIIYIYVGIIMIKEKDKKNKKIQYNLINSLVFALSVSLDSFTVGLVLRTETLNIWHAASTFSMCSASLTYIGLLLGEYAVKLFKNKAPIVGAVILFILAIVNVVEYFLVFI